MKKTLFAFTFAALALAGCSKDDELTTLQPCQINNTGDLQIRSFKSDPYHIYLNGGYRGTVPAYQTQTFPGITAGTYTARAVQASGYVFTASEYTSSITITRCETVQSNF